MKKISDAQLRQKLTPQQYKVLRQRGTEPPFSGEYLHHDKDGVYMCAACEAVLFKSAAKYESSTPGLAGWPSFSELAANDAVELKDDYDLGTHRAEVICKNCGSHLGHVFEDAESKTGKHYCINSCALDFKAKAKN